MTDMTAVGVIRAMHDAGLRVPDDVSVLGFDDISMSKYMVPRLSTVQQPRLEIGRSGAEVLLEILRTTERPAARPHTTVFNPRLILRESTD